MRNFKIKNIERIHGNDQDRINVFATRIYVSSVLARLCLFLSPEGETAVLALFARLSRWQPFPALATTCQGRRQAMRTSQVTQRTLIELG